jgi:hypothetical protein
LGKGKALVVADRPGVRLFRPMKAVWPNLSPITLGILTHASYLQNIYYDRLIRME